MIRGSAQGWHCDQDLLNFWLTVILQHHDRQNRPIFFTTFAGIPYLEEWHGNVPLAAQVNPAVMDACVF